MIWKPPYDTQRRLLVAVPASPTAVIAPHVPSLCLFGCLCLFVLGLVPFWALRESFFLFVFFVV